MEAVLLDALSLSLYLSSLTRMTRRLFDHAGLKWVKTCRVDGVLDYTSDHVLGRQARIVLGRVEVEVEVVSLA